MRKKNHTDKNKEGANCYSVRIQEDSRCKFKVAKENMNKLEDLLGCLMIHVPSPCSARKFVIGAPRYRRVSGSGWPLHGSS